jgi:hypothetical protein
LAVTEEEDALQQAMMDAANGVLEFRVERFPHKGYRWLTIYRKELETYARLQNADPGTIAGT